MEIKNLVELNNITKIYGQNRVLDKIFFDLRPGEVHCLVGENGAGKSTLIKILSGAVTPEKGDVVINGNLIKNNNPRKALEAGVSTMYQDADLIESLSVADNVFLGDEKLTKSRLTVNKRKQVESTKKIIEELKLNLPYNSMVENLSTSQKQMLQIVKAYYRNSNIIIMDEPTSSLGLEETKSLMNLIRTLKKRGMGIIYISHYIDEIFEIGDRVTILKDGEDMGTYDIKEIDIEEVVKKMVNRDASMFYSREKTEIGDVRVQIKDIYKKDLIEKTDLEIRSGEILGIGGLVGSGRSELVSFIFGSLKRDGGEIIIDGKKKRIKSPKDAIKSGICLISEDRKKYGMFGGRNIVENMSVVHNDIFGGPILNLYEERVMTAKEVENLSIMVKSEDQKIEELSGGNQQKVIIGRWLIDDADLYIFDEPTKGVDIGAKEQIYELIVELAKKGKCIIMISSDMPELLSMSDRINVMRNGNLFEIPDKKEITEEKLIKYFIGVQ
jgi:ribose transport system ATP-binding protein